MANNLGISKTLDSFLAALNVKADVDSVSIIQSNITTLNEKINDIDAEALQTTINDLTTTVDSKAPIASPSFTGSPTAPNLFETTQALSGSAISCNSASTFTKTISANTTFTITGVPTSKASTICLLLTNGGSYTVTWPSNVKWPSATVPTLSTGTDLITLFTPNGGTTWYGTLSMTELG